MKWKMAPNSVFAILLRSPWWISLAIAVAVAAAAQALLPVTVRNVGTTAALPFLVVGGVALWRQLRAPSAGERDALLAAAAAMGWTQFEAALREGFARDGYTVRAGQGATDLVLERDGRTTLVAARRWKAARLGEDALAPLQAAIRKLDASGGLVVSLGELTPQALRAAQAHGIAPLQGDALVRLLRRAGVKPKA